MNIVDRYNILYYEDLKIGDIIYFSKIRPGGIFELNKPYEIQEIESCTSCLSPWCEHRGYPLYVKGNHSSLYKKIATCECDILNRYKRSLVHKKER